ncbi:MULTISPECIES: LysR family transcriptional regulator [unclassified Gilliamella]|uniref:LysR family transcriptional regulator n=1 Tax=unclassified Gilliamella TaxID=2685620 RepID=UPI002269BCA1|nr:MULTISPECIES: LysR family transcriptional regulator [unclassified Gilliamella]MCX8665824.1 LysR family transcriptional regulator [Gilliamella sp. B2887]MCX8698092.1 LysR family transcriptional regulator [Gilliamella sp. B3000]
MDFKGLLIFRTIYDLKSLNKAAKALNCTQSNLTAHLKKIEYELQATLFIRGFDGVKPTQEGQQFYHFTLQTLAKYSQLKKSFKGKRNTLLISELLFQFIVIETTKYCIDSTEIVIKRTSDILNQIQHHCYDEVITFEKVKHPDYLLTNTENLAIAFLQSQSIVTPERLPILINNDEHCPLRVKTLTLGYPSEKIITVDSLSQLLNLVERGKGIALLPIFLKKDKLKAINNYCDCIEYYCYQHHCV